MSTLDETEAEEDGVEDIVNTDRKRGLVDMVVEKCQKRGVEWGHNRMRDGLYRFTSKEQSTDFL